MTRNFVSYGARLRRPLMLLAASVALVFLAACGGGGGNNTTPTSRLKHRAFVSNMFAGTLQIVDTQNDTTAFTQQTTNSAGQIVQGQPVSIIVSTSVTFQVEAADKSVTAVYDPTAHVLWIVMNSTEMTLGNVPLTSAAGMALFLPDNSKLYAPEPNLAIDGQRNGGVEAVDRSTGSVSATYAVPSARYIALSPNGQYLLIFADNSDSVFLVNLNATTVMPMEIPGFARPVNAFFSSDSNTAYVLNCGPECGSGAPASVTQLNLPSMAIMASVPVGGASVGLLNGTTLYVAGSPVPPGTTSTFDAVNVSNMTRITTNSVPISDGFHTTMALAPNNKLYIGASSCTNTTTGCLSVVDVSNNTADPALPPRGAITSLLAVANRNVVYAVEGGLLNVYDTTTDTLKPTQFNFQGLGALYSVVQVDP